MTRAQAACQGHDPECWFPLPSNDIMESYAISICEQCPLQVGCLGIAITLGIRVGIWGGRNMATWEEHDEEHLGEVA